MNCRSLLLYGTRYGFHFFRQSSKNFPHFIILTLDIYFIKYCKSFSRSNFSAQHMHHVLGTLKEQDIFWMKTKVKFNVVRHSLKFVDVALRYIFCLLSISLFGLNRPLSGFPIFPMPRSATFEYRASTGTFVLLFWTIIFLIITA